MNEPVLTYRGKTNLDFDMHLDVGSDFEFGTEFELELEALRLLQMKWQD